MVLFFIYQAWKINTPVDGYRIEWMTGVPEEKTNEVLQLIPDSIPEDYSNIKENLEKIKWIKGAYFHKNIKGIMIISMQPRVPLARIKGGKNLALDSEGIIFKSSGLDSLPVVRINGELSGGVMENVTGFLHLTGNLNIKEIIIHHGCIKTKIDDTWINWGYENYRKKMRIYRRIKKEGINAGKLDLRFEGQIILRG